MIGSLMSNTERGQCDCGSVSFRVHGSPLIVHACHCRRCQRQTGTAYAVNALIEEDRVELVGGSVVEARLETPSGHGQTITRCASCQVALWSKYHGLPKIGERVVFVRVGTLDNPDMFPPDVHIHTASRQAHVHLPTNAQAFEGYYKFKETWSPESQRRAAELAAESRG